MEVRMGSRLLSESSFSVVFRAREIDDDHQSFTS